MFSLANRRYLGAKTRLLSRIYETLKPFLKGLENGVFFDAFGGTGVVGEHFIKKSEFSNLIINDFLHSNYAIFNGFFKFSGDFEKLKKFAVLFNKNKNCKENFFGLNFGGNFFSVNDATRIGDIRTHLDELFESGEIDQSEFYMLLASLLFSADRAANTCGHYEAFRRVALGDKFKFELIRPLEMHAKNVQIFRKETNALAKELKNIDVAFLDPPYNSRQYSRCYHFLETLAKNDSPVLSGVAKKPPLENLSEYCNVGAAVVFVELVESLAKKSKILAVTYNNTYFSKSTSSQNKISFDQIAQTLKNAGKLSVFEFDFTPFNAGKTEFDGHKEVLFVCECCECEKKDSQICKKDSFGGLFDSYF